MINLNCGNKWTKSFLDSIIRLNKKYKDKDIRVKELYGNPVIAEGPNLGVRPETRLPKITFTVLKNYINKAYMHDIDINYTLNMSCLGNIEEFQKRLPAIKTWVLMLETYGVKRFTIYSPYLLAALPIHFAEMSTIHGNTSVNYIRSLLEISPHKVDKICLPIYINRDFRKLRTLQKSLGVAHNVSLELIVNEFCVSTYNTCVYRQECYNIQSHGVNFTYPFSVCSQARDVDKSKWLKAPVILPQWLSLYKNTTGITHYKLTGRTLPEKNILKVVEWYMKKECNTDLASLWGGELPHQLKTKSGINTKKLAKSDFLNRFMLSNFECEMAPCDIRCTRCTDFYRKLKEETNEPEEKEEKRSGFKIEGL